MDKEVISFEDIRHLYTKEEIINRINFLDECAGITDDTSSEFDMFD